MAKWFSRRGLIFKAVQKHANFSHLGLVKLYIQTQLLFPRGSIYSTSTSRAEQTTETIKKFKLNLMSFVRNLNWPGRGFELGATEKQIQVLSVTAGLQLGTTGLRVHHAGHWAG